MFIFWVLCWSATDGSISFARFSYSELLVHVGKLRFTLRPG